MTKKLYKISQEIYEELLEINPVDRDNLVCDTTLIGDYGYTADSKEGLFIEHQVNYLISSNL